MKIANHLHLKLCSHDLDWLEVGQEVLALNQVDDLAAQIAANDIENQMLAREST